MTDKPPEYDKEIYAKLESWHSAARADVIAKTPLINAYKNTGKLDERLLPIISGLSHEADNIHNGRVQTPSGVATARDVEIAIANDTMASIERNDPVSVPEQEENTALAWGGCTQFHDHENKVVDGDIWTTCWDGCFIASEIEKDLFKLEWLTGNGNRVSQNSAAGILLIDKLIRPSPLRSVSVPSGVTEFDEELEKQRHDAQQYRCVMRRLDERGVEREDPEEGNLELSLWGRIVRFADAQSKPGQDTVSNPSGLQMAISKDGGKTFSQYKDEIELKAKNVSVPQEHDHGGIVVEGDVWADAASIMAGRPFQTVERDENDVWKQKWVDDGQSAGEMDGYFILNNFTLIKPSPLRTSNEAKEDVCIHSSDHAGILPQTGEADRETSESGESQDTAQSQSATVSEEVEGKEDVGTDNVSNGDATDDGDILHSAESVENGEVEQSFSVTDVASFDGEFNNGIVTNCEDDIVTLKINGVEKLYNQDELTLIHHTEIPCPGDGWERNMGVMPEGEVEAVCYKPAFGGTLFVDEPSSPEMWNYDQKIFNYIAWYKPKEAADEQNTQLPESKPVENGVLAGDASLSDKPLSGADGDIASALDPEAGENNHLLTEWIPKQEWEGIVSGCLSIEDDGTILCAVEGDHSDGRAFNNVEDFLNRFTPKGWERFDPEFDYTTKPDDIFECIYEDGDTPQLTGIDVDALEPKPIFIREHESKDDDLPVDRTISDTNENIDRDSTDSADYVPDDISSEGVDDEQEAELETSQGDAEDLESQAEAKRSDDDGDGIDASEVARNSGDAISAIKPPEGDAGECSANADDNQQNAEPDGGKTVSIADTDGIHNHVSGIGSGHEIDNPLSPELTQALEAVVDKEGV